MQNGEKLCLQWNDFKENVSSAFGQLRGDKELSDVTLACEDGQQIEAHKVILASSSPFFMELLRKNKHDHPLIYMRGLKFEDLAAVVDFLYLGEANVSQDRLDNFLAMAEELKLKGLTGSDATRDNEENIERTPSQRSKLKGEASFKTPSQPKVSQGQAYEYERDASSEKIIAVTNYTENVDLDELDKRIDSMMNTTDKVDHKGFRIFSCNICGLEGAKAHLTRHIEAKHITGVGHSCELCGKTSRSRHALRMHKSNHHSNTNESQI